MPSTSTIWGAVFAACITAIGAVCAAFGPSLLSTMNQPCSEFSDRYNKISALSAGRHKLNRLNYLVADDEYKKCRVYKEAVQERNETDVEVQKAESSSQPRLGDPPIEGKSSVDTRSVATKSSTREVISITTDVSSSPHATDPIVSPAAEPQPAKEAEPPPLKETQTPKQEEAMLLPPTPTRTRLPDVVVRPLTPSFDDPGTPFEGIVNQMLVMRQGARYELRPLRYNTTTYSVVRGKVVVELGGKPYLECEPGNTFRLYWKNKPEFVALSPQEIGGIKVTDVEDGKHLKVSDCVDPSG